MRHDFYLALLAASCAVLIYVAVSGRAPRIVALLASGAFVGMLGVLLAGAGAL